MIAYNRWKFCRYVCVKIICLLLQLGYSFKLYFVLFSNSVPCSILWKTWSRICVPVATYSVAQLPASACGRRCSAVPCYCQMSEFISNVITYIAGFVVRKFVISARCNDCKCQWAHSTPVWPLLRQLSLRFRPNRCERQWWSFSTL